MRGFIGCFILSMLLFMGWAYAAPDPASAIPEQLAAANEQIAVLKAQNQALKEFQDGILSTLWSVIGVMVVVFGLFTYFQTKLRESEVQSMVEVATRQLRQLSIKHLKILLSLLRVDHRLQLREEIEELRYDIEKILWEMELSPYERNDVMEREFSFVCRSYICDYIHIPCIDKHSYEENTQIELSIIQFIEDNRLAGRNPTSGQVRDFFQGKNLYDADVEECLKDYAYYYDNKLHWRPAEWRNRQKRKSEALERVIARGKQAAAPSAASSAPSGGGPRADP